MIASAGEKENRAHAKGRLLASLRPALYLCILVFINVYIAREAFFTESTGHFNSMHGEWMALARLGEFHWWTPSWWRWWGDGAPLEYTYAPLVPVLTRAMAHLGHTSYALAFNQLTGFTYCLMPVLLFLAGWRLSGAAGYSFAAALTCSLASPVTLIVPDTAFRLSSLFGARRLDLVFDWDDLPHVVSLTLLPLAVWFLYRALKRRAWSDSIAACLIMSAMMLANMFGMVLVALIVITVPVTMDARLRFSPFIRAAAIALCSYVFVSPWLPPSLILKVHSNSILTAETGPLPASLIALGIVVLASANVWAIAARRVDSWAFRWLLLFGSVVVLLPILNDYARLHFLPQPERYKMEADVAIAWIAVFSVRPLMKRVPVRAQALLIFILLLIAGRQVVSYRRAAKEMLRRTDPAQSIEYRTAAWIEQHLPGERVFLPGSVFLWANAFTEVPQLGAQPYTTAPNRNQYLANYIITTGDNAGPNDGKIAILWLKAFGAKAVVVSGPGSPEFWKPFWNPRKFDGLLPVVWRERDTTIYLVSEQPFSLAHVLLPGDLVQHPPFNGLDVSEVQRYVAAIEAPGTQSATLNWEGNDRAVIQARLRPGEVVSAQITWYPGWHALVNGSERPIRADGIGLMAIDPGCSGDCRIVLEYTGSLEFRACRFASAGMSVLLILFFVGRGWKSAAGRWRRATTTEPVNAPR